VLVSEKEKFQQAGESGIRNTCFVCTPQHPHYSDKLWEDEKERTCDTNGVHEKCT